MTALFPIALLLLSMACYMAGASAAKTLFAVINPAAVVALRIGFGTLILSVALRPWRIRVTRDSWRPLAIYGISLGAMNLLYCHGYRIHGATGCFDRILAEADRFLLGRIGRQRTDSACADRAPWGRA